MLRASVQPATQLARLSGCACFLHPAVQGVVSSATCMAVAVCPEPQVLRRHPGVQVWASICSAHGGHPGLVCHLHIRDDPGVPSDAPP